MTSILVIDDERTFARNAATYLARDGHDVSIAASVGEGRALFDERAPDVVVLDYRLPDGTGLDLIHHIRSRGADTHIVLVTGHGTIELAVEAMKAGANDLLTKPVALSELRDRIEALARRQRESSRLQWYESRDRVAHQGLLGDAPVMQALRERIQRIAAADDGGTAPPVLVTGETGTGKELVARACHALGARRGRPFIEINCAALPAPLLEAELFGHERGAFTDARERRLGLLEAADGGTLFLDEVGDMDLALQAKILKVIEDGRFRRVGSVREQQVQVRFVAATNRDLEARVAEGAFRADLYFRLRVLQVQVPALRDREGDAVLLARHFTDQFARRYRREGVCLSPAAQAGIAAHRWPGNVRELRNVVEQAVLLCTGGAIAAQELLLATAPAKAVDAPVQAGAEPVPASASISHTTGSVLDRTERDLLVQALARAGQNVTQAARALGISRDTLRYRMERHGLRG